MQARLAISKIADQASLEYIILDWDDIVTTCRLSGACREEEKRVKELSIYEDLIIINGEKYRIYNMMSKKHFKEVLTK